VAYVKKGTNMNNDPHAERCECHRNGQNAKNAAACRPMTVEQADAAISAAGRAAAFVAGAVADALDRAGEKAGTARLAAALADAEYEARRAVFESPEFVALTKRRMARYDAWLQSVAEWAGAGMPQVTGAGAKLRAVADLSIQFAEGKDPQSVGLVLRDLWDERNDTADHRRELADSTLGDDGEE